MRCLLVIDMQEDYVGKDRNIRRYPYNCDDLIKRINKQIKNYPASDVIYITNRFFWENKKKPKKLVNGLSVVNTNIFEKRKQSCFSNEKLIEFLKAKGVDELEIVGVDGNYCVKSSALDGVKRGFGIICTIDCIGIGNKKKYRKTHNKLNNAKVNFV